MHRNKCISLQFVGPKSGWYQHQGTSSHITASFEGNQTLGQYL